MPLLIQSLELGDVEQGALHPLAVAEVAGVVVPVPEVSKSRDDELVLVQARVHLRGYLGCVFGQITTRGEGGSFFYVFSAFRPTQFDKKSAKS